MTYPRMRIEVARFQQLGLALCISVRCLFPDSALKLGFGPSGVLHDHSPIAFWRKVSEGNWLLLAGLTWHGTCLSITSKHVMKSQSSALF